MGLRAVGDLATKRIQTGKWECGTLGGRNGFGGGWRKHKSTRTTSYLSLWDVTGPPAILTQSPNQGISQPQEFI